MYIVKYQLYDNDPLTHRGWYYVYVSSVTLSRAGLTYCISSRDEALLVPECVAEWLCVLLDNEALCPEMEAV